MAATDYDFSLTRTEIIEAAFRKIGVLALGETLSAEMMQQGVDTLNLLAKEWQNDNTFLWAQKLETETLVVGTATYVFAAIVSDNNVLGVDRAWIERDGIETELQIMNYRDYLSIPTKDDSGEPVCLAVRYVGGVAYDFSLWPKPSQADTINLLVLTRMKDLDVVGDSGDFPVAWHKALVWNLASDLAPDYLVPRLDRGALKQEAEFYYQRAKRKDSVRTDNSFVRGSYE